MRVGIVTFHYAPSYGAFFQVYALANYLHRNGHEVVVVDYLPAHRRRAFGMRRRFAWRRGGLTRSNLQWIRDCFRLSLYLSRRVAFKTAVRRHLPLTTTTYSSLEELRASPPSVDACVVGSDQIWNPEKTGGNFDPAYFAAFGAPEMRRLSYAASFGRTYVSDPEGQLPGLLSLLDAISVREQSAVTLVKHHSGRDAVRVLDPTLLLAPVDYPRTRVAHTRRPYVLGYFIGNAEAPRRVLTLVRQILDLKAVDLSRSSLSWWGMLYPGPTQMLALLRSARYVVTNSFHGAALAIRHHVDFTCVGLSGPQASLNTRMIGLLTALGLADRFVQDAGTVRPDELNVAPVCWDDVDHRLAPLQTQSRQFLAQALAR